MIAALVLLAVAAVAGWSLALALLTGRSIALADRHALSGNPVSGNPQADREVGW